MEWEGIAAARRAMRPCVSLCEGIGVVQASDRGAMAGDETKVSKQVISFGSSAED
ncbi:hypothetical protein OKW41_004842 [Paraburkholderia sp. UCT70]